MLNREELEAELREDLKTVMVEGEVLTDEVIKSAKVVCNASNQYYY